MRRKVFLTLAAIGAVLCGSATRADWVPIITYDPAKGLPSEQGWTLPGPHWNGVAPGGQQPYFSQIVQVGGGPELYMNTIDYVHSSDPAGTARHHHAWHSDDKPELDFAQTGFAIETELKMVGFRDTIHGLWIEGQVLGKETVAIQFRPTSIRLFGMGGSTSINVSTIEGLVSGFDYPNVAESPNPHDYGNTNYWSANRDLGAGIEGGDYYTYRLEYDPEEQMRRFWIDGVLINEVAVSTFGSSGGATRYWFGDGVTNGAAEYYIRSLTFSIPEPTSAALLLAGALAGLMAFGRRRRR